MCLDVCRRNIRYGRDKMNLIEAMQIETIDIENDKYTAVMKLGEFHAQPFGYVNGGIILAFAEITAGYASNMLGNGNYHAMGQTISGNHMKAKKSDGFLRAKGELVHHGSRTHVWSIRISDETGKIISMVTVLNALIQQNKKEEA